VHFERPTFAEIAAAVRLTFPMPGEPKLGLTPDSFGNYFAAGGIKLPWKRVPNWDENDFGKRGFTTKEFMSILFSPLAPKQEENIFAITDECFWEGKELGFSLAFGDLVTFAEEVYPRIMSRPMDFFQASDTVFFVEASKLLILLHHEGHTVQLTG
jgi:hypothetical protein